MNNGYCLDYKADISVIKGSKEGNEKCLHVKSPINLQIAISSGLPVSMSI